MICKLIKEIHFIHMKYILCCWVLMLSCTAKIQKRQIKSEMINCCSAVNDDKVYNRDSVFNLFASTLNQLMTPEVKKEKKFYVSENCHLAGAFIWDLTDTLNKATTLSACIQLKEGHVYHFCPFRKNYSYSNIAVLYEGRVRIFSAINCPGKGERIEDVIRFVSDSLQIQDKEGLIKRIRRYREFGAYIMIDEQSDLNCR